MILFGGGGVFIAAGGGGSAMGLCLVCGVMVKNSNVIVKGLKEKAKEFLRVSWGESRGIIWELAFDDGGGLTLD